MPQFTPWAITNLGAMNVAVQPGRRRSVDRGHAIEARGSGYPATATRHRARVAETATWATNCRRGVARRPRRRRDWQRRRRRTARRSSNRWGAAEGGGTAGQGQRRWLRRAVPVRLPAPRGSWPLHASARRAGRTSGRASLQHRNPYNVSGHCRDFLGNPAAQHAAFVAHVANIDQAINNTPGADKFDRNGLRGGGPSGRCRARHAGVCPIRRQPQ